MDESGEERLAAIIDAMPSLAQRDALARLDEEAPELAVGLRARILLFDGLGGLGDEELGALIRLVDRGTLTLALRSSKAELRDRLLFFRPQDEAEEIRSDLDWGGAVALADIERAMDFIRDLAKRDGLAHRPRNGP
jgi:flagellar motor switch protein FliG